MSQWDTYEEVQNTFNKITPYSTTLNELKSFGIDTEKNANIKLLNYSDIANQFIVGLSIDNYVLDKGVSECILAKTNCSGYEINERVMRSKRYGNFWSDLLNFKRKTDIKGWQFHGIILVKKQIVIYKLSNGQPSIHEKVEKNNPLGPLQSGGIALDALKKQVNY